LISDDMQMQDCRRRWAPGGQPAGVKAAWTCSASEQPVRQEQEMAGIAEQVRQGLRDGTLAGSAIGNSIERVGKRKAIFAH